MEPYESDMEGDEQDTPLLPEAHREKHPTAHKGNIKPNGVQKDVQRVVAKGKSLRVLGGMGNVFMAGTHGSKTSQLA